MNEIKKIRHPEKINKQDNISPPNAVQANPTTIPGLVFLSAISGRNFLGPICFSIFLDEIEILFLLPDAISVATFLHTLAICLSKFLTPDSLVYDSISIFIPESLNLISEALDLNDYVDEDEDGYKLHSLNFVAIVVLSVSLMG